ncbi:MAG: hypothetical protein U0641_00665 [Anaerolineae bacterium]
MASPQPLRAGPALAAYRRQMARRTAWVACLRRGSLWLDPLLAAHLPLRPGPLLGTTLAALAAEADAPPDERAAPDRRQARPADRRPGEVGQGWSAPPFAVADRSARPPSPPFGAAPAPDVRWPTDVRRPSRHAASAVGDLPRQAAAALLAPFAGAVLRAAEPQTASLGQVGQLAGRPGGGWQTAGDERRVRFGEAPNRPVATPSPSFPAPKDAAWSARLDGPTAPLSLLTRSASLGPAPASSETPPPRAAGTVPSAPKDGASPAPPPGAPAARAAPDTPFANEGGATFAPSLWGLLDYRVAADAAMPPSPDAETTVRVVNPTLAPRLPFLMPSEPGGPGDLPLAAAVARAGARAEAAGEEDLEELAAKLKRILNEEARRHGIGV